MATERRIRKMSEIMNETLNLRLDQDTEQQKIASFSEWVVPQQTSDIVNHPAHYTQHKSGVECIQITEHMGFCLGNAIKYIWRADLKNGVEDLKKAIWYINREIAKRELKGGENV